VYYREALIENAAFKCMALPAVAILTGLGAYLYLSKESKQKISQ
jgi:hypothetical protein